MENVGHCKDISGERMTFHSPRALSPGFSTVAENRYWGLQRTARAVYTGQPLGFRTAGFLEILQLKPRETRIANQKPYPYHSLQENG